MNNLKQIDSQIDVAINPNALPSGIKALDHNALLHSILKNLGKYVGFAFTAKNSGQVPQGTLITNSNALNTTTPFIISVSRSTQDGNNFGLIIDKAANGDIIHIKDFEGRSSLLKFNQFVEANDGSGNDTYNISVEGFAENPNQLFPQEQDCVIEVIKQSSASNIFTVDRPLVFKKPGGNPNILEPGDWVKTFINETLIIEGVYNGGVDLSDINNFTVYGEFDLTETDD